MPLIVPRKQRYMKSLLLFLSTWVFPSLVVAQVTITDAVLPSEGDVVMYHVYDPPAGIAITPSGGDQTWDFSALGSDFVQLIPFRPASEGTWSVAVPAADLFTPIAQGQELYYRTEGGNLELLGILGQDPAGLGLTLFSRFEPPLSELRTPLEFFDQYFGSSDLSVAFSADDVPGDFLDSLPFLPDSLRLRLHFERIELADAWGSLTMPDGSQHEVLRLKRFETRETRLDVKVGPLPWQDVTDLLFFADFLGVDTTVYYLFFSNEVSMPLLSMTAEPGADVATSVQYQSADGNATATTVAAVQKPGVYVWPNPVVSIARFRFVHLSPGRYTLRLYNVLGMPVWEHQLVLHGDRTLEVDLGHLRKGAYLYSLIDGKGRTLLTKRLVIVRP